MRQKTSLTILLLTCASLVGVTIASVCAATVAAVAQPQQPPPLVAPVFGNSYELSASDNSYDARIPVTLQPKLQPSDISLTKTDVEFNGRHDKDLVDAFTVKWETTTPGVTPALIITVALLKVKDQGTYTLTLNATTTNQPPLELKFKLTRPPAKLRPPTALVIEQVQPLFGKNTTTATRFILREIAGRSRVADVNISQVEVVGEKNRPVTQSITFSPLKEPLLPNGVKEVEYSLSGAFPLGTTKGSAEIISPQLAEPVTVTFEVRARRSEYIIWGILIVGLIAGYLFRTKLQQLIELEETRLNGLELRKRIDEERKQHHDEAFLDQLGIILRDLDNALSKKRAADLFYTHSRATEMAEAIKKANTDFEAAQADLKARSLAAHNNYGALVGLTKAQWSLPAEVAAALTTADGRLPDAHELIDEGYFTEGDEALKNIRNDLAAQLAAPVTDWRNQSEAFLSKLIEEGSYIKDALPAGSAEAVAILKSSIESAQLPGGEIPADVLKALLEAIHTSRVGFRDLMTQIDLNLRSYTNDITETLKLAGVKDQDSLAKLNIVVEQFTVSLKSAVEEPGKSLQDLPNKEIELDTTFRAAVLSQKPAQALETELKDVNTALDQWHYRDAARAILKIVRRIKANEGAILGDLPADKSVSAGKSGLAMAALSESLAPVSTPAVLLFSSRAETHLQTPEGLLVNTWWNLLGTKLLRSLVIGVAIAVVGYLLFADTFIGTGRELAAIFFWAFSLDISMEALTQKIPLLKQ